MIIVGRGETRIQGVSLVKSFASSEKEDLTRARFKLARPLDLETLMAFEEGEGLKALLEVSKKRVDSQGSNTIKVNIKRDVSELLYIVGKKGRDVASFTGKVVNAACVAIVEGNPSLVFSVEADVPSAKFTNIAKCVKRDDTTLAIEEAPSKDDAKKPPKAAA